MGNKEENKAESKSEKISKKEGSGRFYTSEGEFEFVTDEMLDGATLEEYGEFIEEVDKKE